MSLAHALAIGWEVLAFSLHEVHTSGDGTGGFTACVQPSAAFQAAGIASAGRLATLVAEQTAEPTAFALLPRPSRCAGQLPKFNLRITVFCVTVSLPEAFSETRPA